MVDRNALSALDAIVLPVRSVADLSWIFKVRKIIVDASPDCVLSHGFNGHLVSLLGCLERGGISRLASYHGSYHPTTLARKLMEPIYNGFTHWFLRRKATAVLVVAQFCADFLVARGVDTQKITVVHNGIPDFEPAPESREAIRREWGVGPQHVVIGIASRLETIKGLDFLIKAFARVSQVHENARLVLIGDGSQRDVLHKLALSNDVATQVIFTGMRSDVPECLAAMDIFALPSLSEAHSIGLLEAMRASLPIVATDVGGNTESVRNGQEGLIVRAADTAGLAEALGRLLADDVLRACLGAAARQRFGTEFTEEAMLSKTAQWLQRACGG